jgi:hypothetical protein
VDKDVFGIRVELGAQHERDDCSGKCARSEQIENTIWIDSATPNERPLTPFYQHNPLRFASPSALCNANASHFTMGCKVH